MREYLDRYSPRYGVVAAAVVAVFLILGALEREAQASLRLQVPEDDSLLVGEYRKRGIPDPSVNWSKEQYVTTLRLLESLERKELPRAGSDRSGILFERLVKSHLEVPSIATEREGVRNLGDLYAASDGDNLLFDRELVAIRAAELNQLLANSPTRAELRDTAREAAALYRESAHRPELAEEIRAPGRLATQLREYDELLQHSSNALRKDASRLLYLATLADLTSQARYELITHLQEATPQLRRRLVVDDQAWMATEVRGLGRLHFNSAIQQELDGIASLLELEPGMVSVE